MRAFLNHQELLTKDAAKTFDISQVISAPTDLFSLTKYGLYKLTSEQNTNTPTEITQTDYQKRGYLFILPFDATTIFRIWFPISSAQSFAWSYQEWGVNPTWHIIPYDNQIKSLENRVSALEKQIGGVLSNALSHLFNRKVAFYGNGICMW